MRFTLRVILVPIAATVPLACTRYEWVPDTGLTTCNNSDREASARSFTPDQDSAADSGSVRGRVILSDSRKPLPGTSLVLSTDPPRKMIADSLGGFAFTSVPTGIYILRTRHIGVTPGADTLHITYAHTAAFELPLDEDFADGPCGRYMAIRVRKPWWKLW